MALVNLTLCVLVVFACNGLGLNIPNERSKRQTEDLTPGNWDNCQEGGVAPPTRVNTAARVTALRALFASNSIDAYIVPSEDAHQSEYPPDHDLRRQYITGFSGSAGMAVVTNTQAALWTDGRYFLEAEDQLDCNWILMRSGNRDVPSVVQWLNTQFLSAGRIGISPFLFRSSRWKSYSKDLSEGVMFVPVEPELIDQIWTEGRPPAPNSVITALPIQFAGQSWQDKLNETLTTMTVKNVELMIITKLDETAWLFNLRASDIQYNPFFISYTVIERGATNQVTLYLMNHGEKLTQNASDPETTQKVYEHLNTNMDGSCTGRTGHCVTVKEYDTQMVLSDIGTRVNASDVTKVWVSYSCSYAIVRMIPEVKQYMHYTPLALSKTKKNQIEVEGMKKSHIRDAVALISFLAKLETGVQKGDNWTEVSAAEDLKKFREQQEYNRGLSFSSISGFGSNGAIIHYTSSPLTDTPITTTGMYLLDSGGQYLDGTTDVTRTFHFGRPTAYEKECYTRVMMGQIDLFQAVWEKGRYGRELDAFARAPLLEVGLVYRHGTGHGIGMYLSVHEGPGWISLSHASYAVDNRLAVNQFFSDEPGYYETNKFGIRLENIVRVVPANTTNLGCFKKNDPFDNALGELPSSPADINARAFLWTRTNSKTPQELIYSNLTSINSSNFDASKKTYICIHGYMSSKSTPIIANMSVALLKKADVNVIGIDWSHGARTGYPKAVANTRVTGAVVASLVSTLKEKFRLQLSKLHVIGHSLGAHIAGYVGRRTPGIQRITGLDPAGPMFTNTDTQVRLDPTDAVFVDTIHSDAGPILDAGFGTSQRLGHIDFYPNGGTTQPGCPPPVKTTLADLITGHIAKAFDSVSCSHDRAIWYFIESVNTNCSFTGHPCSSWSQFQGGNCTTCGSLPCPTMGYNADQFSATGSYYLSTSSHRPFCVGQ